VVQKLWNLRAGARCDRRPAPRRARGKRHKLCSSCLEVLERIRGALVKWTTAYEPVSPIDAVGNYVSVGLRAILNTPPSGLVISTIVLESNQAFLMIGESVSTLS